VVAGLIRPWQVVLFGFIFVGIAARVIADGSPDAGVALGAIAIALLVIGTLTATRRGGLNARFRGDR